MKNKKSHLPALLAFVCLSAVSNAQLKFPGVNPNPDVKNALEKVISDYPKEFASLKGEVVNTNPQTVEYASLLPFKSAEQNTITRYSGKQPVYSWQALMFTTDDYETAARKYKTLYGQIKGITLTLNRDYTYSLTGDYDKPDESKTFSTTTFQLLPNATNLPRVKVQLALQYEMLEWKIYLQVFQKEREDSERGKITD